MSILNFSLRRIFNLVTRHKDRDIFRYFQTTQYKPITLSYVPKGQLISEANFKVFISTKNERKEFCISAPL